MKPLIVTPGEPAGIGPDLVLALARSGLEPRTVAAADPGLMRARAAELGLAVKIREHDPADPREQGEPGELEILPVPLAHPVRPGHPDPANARSVTEALRRAAEGCQEGRFSGLVTGPVHKSVLIDAGLDFTGHTEFLAELCGTPTPVMMLAAPGLRVALATTHVPLAAVSRALTRERLAAVLRVLVDGLERYFTEGAPRVLVCGLNPHAGEAGHLGREEAEVIEPVLEALRAEGLLLTGPLPADTAFTPPRLREADAVLAMYHDQGLPVLKHMGFGRAVNITLGLPFVRTSVDHGTALELAGSGRADAGSLRAAIDTAAAMVRRAARDSVSGERAS